MDIDFSSSKALAEPVWEGIADCIAGRAEFIADEERWKRDISQYKPEKSFLEQQTRTLGGVPNYLNELLIGRLLKIWNKHLNGVEMEKQSNYDAALAFLEVASGKGPQAVKDAEKGWLVKQIFQESDFDYEEVVNSLRNLSQVEIEEIIIPLTPHPSHKDFQDNLINKWQKYAPHWQLFGQDSLSV